MRFQKKRRKKKKKGNGSHDSTKKKNKKKKKNEIARYTRSRTAAAQNNVRIRTGCYNSTCFETARG